jgi:hypothetical protein
MNATEYQEDVSTIKLHKFTCQGSYCLLVRKQPAPSRYKRESVYIGPFQSLAVICTQCEQRHKHVMTMITQTKHIQDIIIIIE